MKTKNLKMPFLGTLGITSLTLGAFVVLAEQSFKPKDGFVPTEETATRIAEAVWLPIYGKETIEQEKPFQAKLSNGVWTVTGTLPEGHLGGVALAEISKENGAILRVIHGK